MKNFMKRELKDSESVFEKKCETNKDEIFD